MNDDNDTEILPLPGPKPKAMTVNRPRERTFEEFEARYRVLRDLGEKNGMEPSLILDHLPASFDEVMAAPSDSYVSLSFGRPGAPAHINENYRLVRREGAKDSGAGGEIRELRAYISTVGQQSMAAAQLSIAAMNTMAQFMTLANGLSESATKAVKKQHKAQKRASELQSGVSDGMGAIVREIGMVLGPDKAEKFMSGWMERLGVKFGLVDAAPPGEDDPSSSAGSKQDAAPKGPKRPAKKAAKRPVKKTDKKKAR